MEIWRTVETISEEEISLKHSSLRRSTLIRTGRSDERTASSGKVDIFHNKRGDQSLKGWNARLGLWKTSHTLNLHLLENFKNFTQLLLETKGKNLPNTNMRLKKKISEYQKDNVNGLTAFPFFSMPQILFPVILQNIYQLMKILETGLYDRTWW